MTNKYQELIERMDVGKRVKRLEAELDGDPTTGSVGLRAAFFATFRDLKAQERLVQSRAAMVVPPEQAQLAKDDMTRADYQRRSLEAALDYLAEQIKGVEDELAAASKIGSGADSEPGPIAEAPTPVAVVG
jgi:hypothetical protein